MYGGRPPGQYLDAIQAHPRPPVPAIRGAMRLNSANILHILNKKLIISTQNPNITSTIERIYVYKRK